jgi:hypothetical protein
MSAPCQAHDKKQAASGRLLRDVTGLLRGAQRIGNSTRHLIAERAQTLIRQMGVTLRHLGIRMAQHLLDIIKTVSGINARTANLGSSLLPNCLGYILSPY